MQSKGGSNHAAPSTPASEDSAGPELTSPEIRWFHSVPNRGLIWTGILLFQAGITLGVVSAWMKSKGQGFTPSMPSPTLNVGTEATEDQTHQGYSGPSAKTRNDLDRADDWLRQERFDHALAQYQSLNGESVAATSDGVCYRIALCLEGLERWDHALAAYTDLANRSSDPYWPMAELGEARVRLSLRQPQEAIEILSKLLLRSAEAEFRGQPCFEDVRPLLALALAMRVSTFEESGPESGPRLSHASSFPGASRLLEWAGHQTESETVGSTATSEHIQLERTGPEPTEFVASVRLVKIQLQEVFQRLAAETGVPISCTTVAERLVAGRMISVAVENASATSLLAALTEPLGLVWQIQDNRFRIAAAKELSGQDLARNRRWLAEQSLIEGTSNLSHPQSDACLLELGNLVFSAGRHAESITIFERVVGELPRSELLPDACYNLALAHQRLGDTAQMRKALLRIIDGSSLHRLASQANLMIGRSYLEEATPERAISPLRRVATSRTELRAASAIPLAMAYLLTDNPRAANAVILEHREQLSLPSFRNAAAFLDAYSRYKAVPNHQDANQESRALLAALVATVDDPLLGSAGMLLVGQAFRDLGLDEKAASVYAWIADNDRTGKISTEAVLALAELMYATGQVEAATKQLETLASSGQDKATQIAYSRLAEISLQEGRPKDCLNYCGKLLQSGDYQDSGKVLKLMGQAHNKLGDYRRAATCFSGQCPELPSR